MFPSGKKVKQKITMDKLNLTPEYIEQLLSVEEQEVLPGVFMTDYRDFKIDKSNMKEMDDQELDKLNLEDVDQKLFELLSARLNPEVFESHENLCAVIDSEINSLNNSIFHLIRSNDELMVFYDEERDPFYLETVEENRGFIEQKRDKIEELKFKKNELLGMKEEMLNDIEKYSVFYEKGEELNNNEDGIFL